MFQLGKKGNRRPSKEQPEKSRIDPRERRPPENEDKTAAEGISENAAGSGAEDAAGAEATTEEKSAASAGGTPEAGAGGTPEAGAGGKAAASEREQAHPGWRVTAARDLSTAYLDFDPAAEGEPPAAREVLDEAIGLGVNEDVLFTEETLDRAIRNTLSSGIALKRYAISEDRDAFFEITVSEDKLKAELTIVKGCGRGEPLDLKELGRAIRTSGLKGLDFAKIKEDILSFYRGDSLRLDDYVLAEGSAPVPGKPQEITWEVEFLDEAQVEKHKLQVRETGEQWLEPLESLEEKPVEEVSEMAMVKAESIVISLSAKDPGTPGTDVYGAVVQPPDPPSPPLRPLEHLRLGGDTVVAERDGVLDRWEREDGVHAFRVRSQRDCRVSVNISQDAMLASVKLVEGVGTGRHLSAELVRQTLIDEGVIKGIDMDAVTEAVRRSAEEGDESEVVVARGRPPVEPGESNIKFKVALASGKGVSIKPDGTADFKNQDRITNVEAGQAIAEIVSDEVKPEDGWDVRSNAIKAKDTPRLPIETGDGIRSEPDGDGHVMLYAEKGGELLYDGSALAIGDIHTIQGDVGQATGNIKFGGSVNISGSVRAGFFVMSKGTVKIAEGVEGALVSADESIFIQQGVKGAGKAVLRARSEIRAGFIEQTTVMSIGDIVIQNTCLQCTIKGNGSLSLKTEKGKLVGGRILMRRGVSAAQIGSPGGVQTHISFGQDYLISDKIELEEKEIGKLQQELVRLDGKIHAAERDGATADVRKGRARKVQLLKLVEKRTERLFWLRERFEQHFPSQVEVRGTIYPGVTLESHGRELDITTEKKSVVFTFDPESGHINEQSIEK